MAKKNHDDSDDYVSFCCFLCFLPCNILQLAITLFPSNPALPSAFSYVSTPSHGRAARPELPMSTAALRLEPRPSLARSPVRPSTRPKSSARSSRSLPRAPCPSPRRRPHGLEADASHLRCPRCISARAWPHEATRPWRTSGVDATGDGATIVDLLHHGSLTPDGAIV